MRVDEGEGVTLGVKGMGDRLLLGRGEDGTFFRGEGEQGASPGLWLNETDEKFYFRQLIRP